MKLPRFFGFLLVPLALALPLAAFGKDTAYQALRTIGSARDQGLLNHVVEVKGTNGASQPEKWTIVLDDPLARGGVREVEVANGHIISERTPVKSYSGTAEGIAMNFKKLNLDSEGAFTIAVDQAKAAKIGFESVDYVLRCDDTTGAPTWVLQLLDERQHSVGSLSISADNGAILDKSFGRGTQGPRFGAIDSDRAAIGRKAEVESTDEEPTKENLGHRVDRTIHRAGASVEEFFTGRRSWDRRFRGE